MATYEVWERGLIFVMSCEQKVQTQENDVACYSDSGLSLNVDLRIGTLNSRAGKIGMKMKHEMERGLWHLRNGLRCHSLRSFLNVSDAMEE